jgi:nicotinamide-nucleotide amidase
MQDLVEKISVLLTEREWMIATVESCTAGLLAAAITHRPGASAIFERGFVTYSNRSKIDCLGVSPDLLTSKGAVSGEVAEAMAVGAIKNSPADLAVSITGIAGPDGGTDEKPVGLVYFGFALRGGSAGSIKQQFEGTREHIRGLAAATALKHMITILEQDGL